MPLTDVALRKLKPGAKAVRIADEKGLYLQVAATGSMWWRFKFRIAGKEKLLALGVYHEVSLKEARDKRDEARAMLRGSPSIAMASSGNSGREGSMKATLPGRWPLKWSGRP